jgi:hypothetical protein
MFIDSQLQIPISIIDSLYLNHEVKEYGESRNITTSVKNSITSSFLVFTFFERKMRQFCECRMKE